MENTQKENIGSNKATNSHARLEQENVKLQKEIDANIQELTARLATTKDIYIEKKIEQPVHSVIMRPIGSIDRKKFGTITHTKQGYLLADADISYIVLTDTVEPNIYKLRVRLGRLEREKVDPCPYYDTERVLKASAVISYLSKYGVSISEAQTIKEDVQEYFDNEIKQSIGYSYEFTLKINKSLFADIYRDKFIVINKDESVYDNGYTQHDAKDCQCYPEGATTKLSFYVWPDRLYTSEELMKVANTHGNVVKHIVKQNTSGSTSQFVYLNHIQP